MIQGLQLSEVLTNKNLKAFPAKKIFLFMVCFKMLSVSQLHR
jgi:hypothetical protein